MVLINNNALQEQPEIDLEAYDGMRHMRTLMIEPSLPQQKIIRQEFEEQGVFDIQIVDSGGEALGILETEDIDLIVSAMYLPDMTGYQLIHTMREHEDYQYIPFLLISSEDDPAWLEPMRQAGVVGILPKPFAIDALQRALCAAYDLHFSARLRESSSVNYDELDVLLVDDSLFSRNHIRRVIGNLGVTRIDLAEDGKQALKLMDGKQYDVLITDYHMPEMDGKALIEHVREQGQQQDIPALMITSELDEDVLEDLRQCGASAVCNKPFEPRIISDVIQHMLNA